MTNQKATKRYFFALVPAAIIFLGTSYAIRTADNAGLLPTPWLYGAALLPVAALLSLFWAHWRYMTEIDEFLRSIQFKALFAALTVVMVISSGWGYLEFYADAPPLSIFWLNPLYWIAYGVAVVIFNVRDGGAA